MDNSQDSSAKSSKLSQQESSTWMINCHSGSGFFNYRYPTSVYIFVSHLISHIILSAFYSNIIHYISVLTSIRFPANVHPFSFDWRRDQHFKMEFSFQISHSIRRLQYLITKVSIPQVLFRKPTFDSL